MNSDWIETQHTFMAYVAQDVYKISDGSDNYTG